MVSHVSEGCRCLFATPQIFNAPIRIFYLHTPEYSPPSPSLARYPYSLSLPIQEDTLRSITFNHEHYSVLLSKSCRTHLSTNPTQKTSVSLWYIYQFVFSGSQLSPFWVKYSHQETIKCKLLAGLNGYRTLWSFCWFHSSPQPLLSGITIWFFDIPWPWANGSSALCMHSTWRKTQGRNRNKSPFTLDSDELCTTLTIYRLFLHWVPPNSSRDALVHLWSLRSWAVELTGRHWHHLSST